MLAHLHRNLLPVNFWKVASRRNVLPVNFWKLASRRNVRPVNKMSRDLGFSINSFNIVTRQIVWRLQSSNISKPYVKILLDALASTCTLWGIIFFNKTAYELHHFTSGILLN
jgi:hypothetical protein